MNNNFIRWAAPSYVIMALLPLVAAQFVGEEARISMCLLLTFIFNPIYCAVAGYFSGKNMREMWGLPIVCAIAYLTGPGLFLVAVKSAAIMCAGIYFVIGTAVMSLSALAAIQQ